jgi:hypothetical protein
MMGRKVWVFLAIQLAGFFFFGRGLASTEEEEDGGGDEREADNTADYGTGDSTA